MSAWFGTHRRSGGAPERDRRDLDAIKDRHNLSDVIGPYTQLKQRGREMVGLCPFHHEKTPSFEVNDDKGFYHCHGCCAGGDHFSFLMTKCGMSFVQALRSLNDGQFPVVSPEERARRREISAAESERRRTLALSIWHRSVPIVGTPGEVYARSRGITVDLPHTVRFVMAPRWIDPKTGEPGRDYPAVVCALQDATAVIVGVQCIFLQAGGRQKYRRVRDDGTVAKAKLTFGNIVGSALRLGPLRDEVMLCEGPEDGWTLMQRYPDRTVWVSCGTALMSRVIFPGEVSSVILAGDNGTAGRQAVADASDAYFAAGMSVREYFPDPAFKDFNDELRGIRC